MTEGTLVYIVQGKQILLALKKRGFGEGKWNGAGGKLQPGETPIDGAIRETKEEIGVIPTLDQPIGKIHFHDPKQAEWLVHVFRTEVFEGQPIETEEMRPQWFPHNAIPYDLCWADDRVWLPLLLTKQKFEAEIWLAEDGRLAKHTITKI